MNEMAVPEDEVKQDVDAVVDPVVLDGLDEQLVGQLVGQARARV